MKRNHWSDWWELLRCHWHGPLRRMLPALGLMFLITFQEFEAAALRRRQLDGRVVHEVCDGIVADGVGTVSAAAAADSIDRVVTGGVEPLESLGRVCWISLADSERPSGR